MNAHRSLILASSSPRRQQLLREAGYRFRTISPALEEPSLSADKPFSPASWAEALAYYKARAVADQYKEDIVLGADTIVVHDGNILGKPRDEQEARAILTTHFAGRNEVITGVSILCAAGGHRVIAHDISVIMMRAMTEEELEAYLASGAWQGKAGAYALQEGGDSFVETLQGSVSNIVGLPLELLERLLKEFDENDATGKG